MSEALSQALQGASGGAANDTVKVVLQAVVTVFGDYEASIDMTVAGGPFSIALTFNTSINLTEMWHELSAALESKIGFGLPDLGAWSKLIEGDVVVTPSAWLGPSGEDPERLSMFLSLDLAQPINVGGSIEFGGFKVWIEPNFSVEALYIGYDAAAGGMQLRARVTTQTTLPNGGRGQPKTQIVSYPFPVPAQDNAGTFQLHYLGLGQRVGPTVQVGSGDPMAAIFDQLESELRGDDVRSVITTLARQFYQPDRDWFIALDAELKGFRLRLLFNDPAMYGLEISVASNAASPFAGLLFEILYQKLSPNLGLYYGALTLPTLMRRIPLEGFVLILPGFQIWVYTNGDFRVNVGWPLGDNSIAISFDILVGRAGFYFAKLRSGDNPGAQSSIDYNPILAFGMGVSVSAGASFNASIFSASINVVVSATFQGLLAWKAGNSLASTPDHYWFAATAGLSVLIQGSVDFAILRASVTISFTANAGVAFETGYATHIAVSAEVTVAVSVKVIFFTIHLSFHTSVATQFDIGQGPPASVNGPLAPGLAIVGGFGLLSHAQIRALELAESRIDGRPRGRSAGQRLVLPPQHDVDTSRPRPRPRPFASVGEAAPPRLQAAAPGPVELRFVLQPTATYGQAPSFAVVASLLTDCPAPGAGPSPQASSFQNLVQALVDWLLTWVQSMPAQAKLSARFQALVNALGHGAHAPLGDWAAFEAGLRHCLATQCTFSIVGVQPQRPSPDVDGAPMAVLPMFDTLRMTAPDGTQVDFDTYGAAPADYPVALDFYFQDLAGANAVSGASSAQARAAGLATAATGSPPSSPATRSMATFVFLDYFLMLCRQAVSALATAALAYEQRHREAFIADVDSLAAQGLAEAASVLDYVRRLDGDTELAALMAEFDYASAAGIGSRFLLGGLQLPDPNQLPAVPTPESMTAVPTQPLFLLTGQQWPAAAGADATAVLCTNPASTLPPLPIDFGGSPAAATAAFTTPAQVPPEPLPAWSGPVSPHLPGEGELVFDWVAPVTQQPAYVALKSQVGWERAQDSGTQLLTLLPLPQALTALRAARHGLLMSVSEDPPPRLNAGPDGSPPPPLVAAEAVLQIRLSLTQVPSSQGGAITADGPPVPGSPSANARAQSFLPNVYQLSGTDAQTRDLIHLALASDLSQASLSLLHSSTAPAQGGSPGRTVSLMTSETLSPQVQLIKTNLSTLNLAPQAGPTFAALAEALPKAEARAALTDVAGFLRLLWELSVVNAPGFFLFYESASGADLPASLFTAPGGNGGQAAELDIVLSLGAAGMPTAVPACANSLVVYAPGRSDPWYAALSDPSTAQPLQVSTPSYPAGALAFQLQWQPWPDDAPVPVHQLYHLLQVSVLGEGGYEASDWSLPIGPVQDTAAPGSPATPACTSPGTWPRYLRSIPASAFLPQASGQANRYDIIDRPLSIALRIVDIYGNPLPTVETAKQTPLYQDPIIGPAEWPGLFVSYGIEEGTGSQAVLALDLRFDPQAVVPDPGSGGGSPASGIAPGRARDAWQATLGRYQLIIDQLTDSHMTVTLACSLAGGTLPGASPHEVADGLAALARDIAQHIEQALAAAPHSPDVPDVKPAQARLALPLPFAALQALTQVIVPLTVSLTLARPQALVAPEALTTLPAVASVTQALAPDLQGGGSPEVTGGLSAFAATFESAFQDFDGQGGCLKLAQRAGVTSAEMGTLSVMRWSATHGVNVKLGSDFAFFALQPLCVQPITGTVAGITWTDIDLDAWARDFLVAFDALLSPAAAMAIALIDSEGGASPGQGLYEQLLGLKFRLARAISLGLSPLFESSEPVGDIAAARERLEQALLSALASAFNVSTVAQVPATISLQGCDTPASPAVAPRLFGGLGAPLLPGGSPSTASGAYSLSGGNLDLFPGCSWMSTLLTVAQTDLQSQITLAMAFEVSYVQDDFDPGAAYLGYVPSAWLKFALPQAAPLQMPIAEHAVLPVPLIFRPMQPVLVQQTAQPAALGSPASPHTASDEIAAAMQWLYGADLGLQLAAQDQLFFDVTYNEGATSLSLLAGEFDPVMNLFEQLAAFQAWYPQVATALRSLTPGAVTASPAASPASAQTLVQAFCEHAANVTLAWEGLHDGATALDRPQPESLDHFCLLTGTAANGDFEIQLLGRSDQGGPPRHWPTMTTADGQHWVPSGSPSPAQPPSQWGSPASPTSAAGSPAEGGWFSLSQTFSKRPSLASLSLCFGPLEIMQAQSATLSTWIVRNADLIDGRRTAPAFIYRTPMVDFPAPIVPLIHRHSLPPVTPGPSLAATLAGIFEPIEQVGLGGKPSVQVSVAYQYEVSATVAALVTTPVTLLSSPSTPSARELATTLAAEVAGWYFSNQPSTRSARLALAVTVFGTQGSVSLPLVQFDEILIPTGDALKAWWTGAV